MVKGLRAHSFTPAWWPGVIPSSEVRSPFWRVRLERLLDLGPSSAVLPRSHSVANLRPPRSGPSLLATATKMGQKSRNGLMPPAPRPLGPQGQVDRMETLVLVLTQQECLSLVIQPYLTSRLSAKHFVSRAHGNPCKIATITLPILATRTGRHRRLNHT